MKRKELEDLGIAKEQVDTIMKLNDADLEEAKTSSTALTVENESLTK